MTDSQRAVGHWRGRLRLIWLGARFLWLLGDFLILVLYFTERHTGDAEEATSMLLLIWTAPLGSLSLVLYNLIISDLGFHLGGATDVLFSWLLASSAGCIQYFIILPRLLKRL